VANLVALLFLEKEGKRKYEPRNDSAHGLGDESSKCTWDYCMAVRSLTFAGKAATQHTRRRNQSPRAWLSAVWQAAGEGAIGVAA
jgi:hypothetical protein